MLRPGWIGTWTGLHGKHLPHLDLQVGGDEPGPASRDDVTTTLSDAPEPNTQQKKGDQNRTGTAKRRRFTRVYIYIYMYVVTELGDE